MGEEHLRVFIVIWPLCDAFPPVGSSFAVWFEIQKNNQKPLFFIWFGQILASG